MKRVVILSDTLYPNFKQDIIEEEQIFTKNSSGLRLAYGLRKKGIWVFPVYNYTAFSNEEFNHILNYCSENRKHDLIVCFSTSFMVPGINRNVEQQKWYSDHGIWGDNVVKTTDFLKISKKYNAITLMGGWGISTIIPDIFKSYVDLYVINDGVDIITKFVNPSYTLKDYGTFKFEKNMRFFIANDIKDFTDQASTPLITDHINIGESLTTELSGGCVFSCSFCNYKILGKKRDEFLRSYDSLKTELQTNFDNFGTTYYTFTDNIMNDYLPKLDMLIRFKDETGIDIKWTGYSRLDIIKDREHAQKIKDSGAIGVTFGIESFNKQSGPYIGKMTDGERIKEHLQILRDVIKDDVTVNASMICGLPYETEEKMRETFEWLNSKEGKYLIDSYSYSSLLLFDNQDDKNDINKARNNPFKDYIKENFINWTSPWGTYKQYERLAREFNKELSKKNRFKIYPFILPILKNADLDIDKIISMFRKNETFDINLFKQYHTNRINKIIEYKNKVVNAI